MSDTILTMDNGSKWFPSTSVDMVHCATCENAVDTPEEVATYPDGNCPQCNNPWTGAESRSTTVIVTAPAPASASTMP